MLVPITLASVTISVVKSLSSTSSGMCLVKLYPFSSLISWEGYALMLYEAYWTTALSRCCSWVLMGSSPALSAITALNLSCLNPMEEDFLQDLVNPDDPFSVELRLLRWWLMVPRWLPLCALLVLED